MTLFHRLALVLTFVVSLLAGPAGQPAFAQGFGPDLPGSGPAALLPDYEQWQRVATRAARVSESGQASEYALERLRSELLDWRERFLAAQSTNAARIDTVRRQITALGPLPTEGQTEDPLVASRRSDLESELARLRAPSLLAIEAHAEASGLISEIDQLETGRLTEVMMTRGPSPLNPANWPEAIMLLWSGMDSVIAETLGGIAADQRSGALWRNLPFAGLLAVVGLILMWRGRPWGRALQARILSVARRGQGVWYFLLSLLQLVLPYAGVLILIEGAKAADVMGYRGLQLAASLPDAALFLIVSRWLSGHYFEGRDTGMLPIDFGQDERRQGRKIMFGLGWTLLASTLVLAVAGVDPSQTATAMLSLPSYVLIAIFLFWLGRLFVMHGSDSDGGTILIRSKILTVVGRACQILAILGPVLSAIGYSSASELMLFPAVKSLALAAVVVLLQKLVTDLYVLVAGRAAEGSDGLIPVLLGILLLFAALPILALFWGASTDDLAEIWSRFHHGFTIGDSRISPTDFLMFAIIFAIGFTLTRLVQGTLRTTVLPKTRIDIGGQNAIVSGLGYVGIFLAALIAITSAGIDLSSLAIVAGALSVGIGFGLQNIVSNFVSGIILLIERPISEGDWIEVGGQMGYVRDISVRSTRIETFDRTDVIIPNADLVSGQVTNWTRGNSVGRVIVPVGVAYGTDTMRVDAILREIAEAHPMVLLTPPPNIAFMGFGADSLNFEIRAILRDVNFSLVVRTEMNHAIAARFKDEGIEIPFAQRDIWLRNPEALHPKAPASAKAASAQPEDQAPAAPAKPVLREED